MLETKAHVCVCVCKDDWFMKCVTCVCVCVWKSYLHHLIQWCKFLSLSLSLMMQQWVQDTKASYWRQAGVCVCVCVCVSAHACVRMCVLLLNPLCAFNQFVGLFFLFVINIPEMSIRIMCCNFSSEYRSPILFSLFSYSFRWNFDN